MLKGKVALITGASRGIGKEIALTLAKSGADVALVYFGNSQMAEEVKCMCQGFGVKAKAYRCDVADFDESERTVKEVTEDFGGIDILVNNAGITKDMLVLQMKSEDFSSVIDTNLKGVFNMIKHCCRNFMKKKYGKIINISSVSGLIGNPGQANYSASKAGIIGLTKTVAKELAGRNVCCNAIAPGFIKTDMTESFEGNEAVISAIPMKKMGDTKDVANLALFLAGSGSDYITGETIRVDGGMAM